MQRPLSDRTPPAVHHVPSLSVCVRASLNGNQVLSARAGLLLHRQLGASASRLTSSPGAPTSKAPRAADKVVGLRQTGQQMGRGMGGGKHSLLWTSIQHPGQLFSLDVKGKQAATLWELSNRLLVKAAGKRRNVGGLMRDGRRRGGGVSTSGPENTHTYHKDQIWGIRGPFNSCRKGNKY